NVTVEGIKHIFTEEVIAGKVRQSYTFMNVELAANVTFKDMSVVQHKGRYLNTYDDKGNITGKSNFIGSYEFGSKLTVNTSWYNCKQRNFFATESGALSSVGVFGTNYSRNMHLRDCLLNSFDSHAAAYNVTIENSTFEHLNFIGAGDVYLNYVTVYLNSNSGIRLRQDYGTRWYGNFYINNLELRYDKVEYEQKIDGKYYFDLLGAYYENHDYGYGDKNTLPAEIHVNGIEMYEYTRLENANTYEFDENGRLVQDNKTATDCILIIYKDFNYNLGVRGYDYKNPANNKNNIVCTEKIYLNNVADNLEIKYPTETYFKNMQVFIDDVKQNWYKG
ncbi:MAG: hypothetical protein IKY62_06340, partial [Clostridia bacterium]|nr:hypothetical protein [Clostridia bacterium]